MREGIELKSAYLPSKKLCMRLWCGSRGRHRFLFSHCRV